MAIEQVAPTFDALKTSPIFGPSADKLMPVLDHLTLILGNTLTQVIPSLSITSVDGNEIVDGRVIKTHSILVDQKAILPVLKDLMVEFPGILQGLTTIHNQLGDVASNQTGDPLMAPTTKLLLEHLTDQVEDMILRQLETSITPAIEGKLAVEVSDKPVSPNEVQNVAFQLVSALTSGEFWNIDRSGVISPADDADLTELLGHRPSINWLHYGLKGDIDPNV